MRRSQVDDARRQQAAAERRFRGRRIRGGLDELGDLDAPQQQKERKEIAMAASASFPTDTQNNAKGAASTTMAAATALAGSPLLSSSTEVFRTVFGTDWSEWVEVKRVLFDMEATVAAKRTALDTVQLWHLRARKERVLPPYVEATSVLLDAMLQDESDALTDGPQRMCYGAAISRVVHVMTGSFASGQADTYRKRAREIGFPEEAVEVRQRVAHGVLPLTSELRWVCGLVLQFLFTEYWLEQERQLYLMEQAGEKPVESHASEKQVAAAVKKQKGRKAEKSAAGAAGAVAHPSVPPPAVSMDDIKALLADLEEDKADPCTTKVATDKVSVSPEDARIVEKQSGRVTAAASKDTEGNTVSLNGWLLS
ncbi:hypothetical protein ABB37_06615 [Leptomonas pyrrhocoris]|uniref:Las1-like protein n=1 Tax=Leptomonas pyrrhocoris TaxID=157538 RepID=A0A0M9FX74_LEPPY|nr:hypothetical protein ABB37_06615 [Leptomonas pyrrhocoris]KPA77787.1 hypothetical protein ABB37_06615 [Leptomonas pyrrhocoris]|eukprot:XP_015656226.1 hypothetical protein ABB37_06615 [Leptomonas pyrrhocoris]